MANKSVKLEIGSVYQKKANDNYYFRYQINDDRKSISLKTKNQKEAIKKAQDMIPILKATTTDVISAHVKQARGLAKRKKSLVLADMWEVYSKHPERATPATVHEQHSYRATLKEFITFVKNDSIDISSITTETTDSFAQHLRGTEISVATHNRKIKRLRKIFETLKGYYDAENPFDIKSIRRKAREEQEHTVRRVSFSHKQTSKILEVLEDDSYIVKNKAEIRVVYHLGIFTGQRLKDCVLLRWDKVDLDKRKIWVKQFKTGKEVTIPMAPKLFEVLNEAKEWKTNHYICPNVAKRYNRVDKNGKNTGNNLVGVDVLRVIRWIGLETSVEVPGRKRKVTVHGFHSLRHSFASHCAEAGVPKAVVISILGANSEIVDKHYTHIGEEAQEKAIQSLFGNGNAEQERQELRKLADTLSIDQIKTILKNIKK